MLSSHDKFGPKVFTDSIAKVYKQAYQTRGVEIIKGDVFDLIKDGKGRIKGVMLESGEEYVCFITLYLLKHH